MDLLRLRPPPLELFQEGRGRNEGFSQMMQLEKFDYEKAKGAVASLISSYNTTKSGAMRDHIVRTMKGYYQGLPLELQKSVDPYIAHGPTSPMSEKRREFVKHNPVPEPPMLLEGDDSILAQTSRVNYLFKRSDWDRELKGFLFGASSTGDKMNLISFGDGSAAMRNKDGQVMMLSQSDLKLNEMSEKYGIDVKDILLGGGIIPTGSKGVSVMGGRKITTEDTVNLFATDPKERFGTRITGIEPAPKSAWDFEHPEKLTGFLLDWKGEDTDNETVKRVRSVSKKSPRMAEQMLTEIFPQYSFRIIPRKTRPALFGWIPNFVPFFSANHTQALIPIRGKPIPLEDQSGKRLVYYYDQALDLVSNEFGIPLGSYAQVSESVKARVIEVKKLK